jgi:hypothetical protein
MFGVEVVGREMVKGVCKLTGQYGKFIDAHLIPKALTRPEKKGSPFVQAGSGSRPNRRWSSWYDNRLVTQAGEDILTALDTWAITELRKHKLVWSGWGPMQSLSESHTQIPGTPWGIREIEGIDPQRLRLFFLSLLWRAAATEREEFSEVVLPHEDVERLRLMLLNNDPQPLSFYPTQLTQLSTLGIIHNHTPLLATKTIPAFFDRGGQQVPFFRFYFDGLIAHMHCQTDDATAEVSLGPLVVGADQKLAVPTVRFEESFQMTNLMQIMGETEAGWPEVMTRI